MTSLPAEAGESDLTPFELAFLEHLSGRVGGDPGWLSSDWVLVGVLCFSALAAFASIAAQRVIAKKRAAYDYMVDVKSSRSYIEEQAVFIELTRAKTLDNILDAKTTHEKTQMQAVRNYLNYYELLCISIEMNIVDEDVCKAYVRDTLLKRWADSQSLIAKIRTDEETGGSSTTFEYFERVARRWQAEPHLKSTPSVTGGIKRLVRELFRL